MLKQQKPKQFKLSKEADLKSSVYMRGWKNGYDKAQQEIELAKQQTALAIYKNIDDKLVTALKKHRFSTKCHVECPCWDMQKLITEHEAEIKKLSEAKNV